jgi:trans-aconitate 2-methyltransferase
VHTVTGVDFAHDMLKRARTEFEKSTLGASMNVNFEQRDLSSWVPDEKNIDLIFSNALYHWIPDHQSLFPRLLAAVKPETGILAIQMPRNFRAPSHTILRALALDSQYEWSQYLSKEGALGAAEPVADPAVYYNMLAPHASRVDIWETEYLQPLAPAANPVLEWVRGTTLVPYQSVLTREGVPKGLWEQFEAEYAARLRAAYPADAQTGITLYPFKRIFIVASPKS